MQTEIGVTNVSLENAKELLDRYGIPSLVVLTGDPKKGQYVTTAYWGLQKQKFEFHGFSWGYSGEGPSGLVRFLEMCKHTKTTRVDVSMINKVPYVIEI